MTLLLTQPDTHERDGRRDLALLSLMYDSGARVQEICDLTVRGMRLQNPATITLTGKGRKTRIVPLSAPNAEILKRYISERGLISSDRQDEALFTNRQGVKLTRECLEAVNASRGKITELSKEMDKLIERPLGENL